MKLFFEYIKPKLFFCLAFLLFCGIFTLAFFLYELPLRAVLYPAGVCLLFGICFVSVGLRRFAKKHKELSAFAGRDFSELCALPPAKNPIEEDYEKIILSLKDKIEEITARDDLRFNNTVEYYTLWAHQIKTPIAAMKLALEGEDSALSRRLCSELFRIERYVEMVMTFLRLESESTDYVFSPHDLDGLIKKSVKSFSAEFIDKKLSLAFTPTKMQVVTDEKWLCFVLEQLLSNAVKYTKKGGVKIYAKDDSLFVEDSGIGIAPEDLPRIFERGYTGVTGRSERHSSGIGLFLCGKICKNLGIDISAVSEVSKGTVFKLKFAKKLLKDE